MSIARRIGRFRVPRECIETEPESLLALFADYLPIKIEATPWDLEYTALSPAFEDLAEGEPVPVYYWTTWTRADGGMDIKPVRQP